MSTSKQQLFLLVAVLFTAACLSKQDAPTTPGPTPASTDGAETPAATPTGFVQPSTKAPISSYADELTIHWTGTKFQVKTGGVTDTQIASANKDGTSGTASMRTLGTGAQQAAPGNIKLDTIGAPTDVTTNNATTSAHGLLLKLDNNAAHFMNGQGAWATPAGGGGGTYTADELTLHLNGSNVFSIKSGGITDTQVASANKDGTAGTASLRTLGTSATQATAGNDSRLSDARTPTAHAATHKNGGGDEVAVATAAANAIPKAGAGGTLSATWLPALSGDVTSSAGSAATTVGKITETGGPTTLTIGTITDGQFLKRAGSTVVSSAAGTGDALTSGTLAQFASTTSAQLAGVLSDETGSGGGFVRATSPAIGTPTITSPAFSGTVSTAIAMGTNKITGLGDPTSAQDAATKTYVDTPKTPGTYAFGSTVSLNVATNADYQQTDTVTGTMALTLTNGADGYQGTIGVVQDGTGHAVTIAATGRTVTYAANVGLPSAASERFTIGYLYSTENSVAYLHVFVTEFDTSTSTLADGSVTLAKMANLANGKLIGRATSGTGVPEAVTVGTSLEFSSTTLQRSALTGDVTASAGSNATTIATAAVTLAKMADLAQDQFIGRTTASTGVPQTATITAAARTVLDDTTVSAMVDTLGGTSAQGTGAIVRATSPTLTTPNIGIATATAINSTDSAVSFSGTPTFDISAHDSFVLGQITSDFAITLSNPAVGQSGTIAMVQDGTGNHKITGITVTGFTVIMLVAADTSINTTEFKVASARSVLSYKLVSVNSVNICYVSMSGGQAAAYGLLDLRLLRRPRPANDQRAREEAA